MTVGVKVGTSVTDRTRLTTNISKLSETWRSAVIKVCTSSSTSAIVGLQIGIADYSLLASGSSPASTDVIWLSGVGTVTVGTFVKCAETYIPKGAGL